MIDTKAYVIKQIEERDIRFLRLWFTDLLGGLKNVAITPSDVESAFEEGVGFDGASVNGLAPLQESDMLAHPDPSTFQMLPWRPANNGVARMFCDIRTPDGAPAAGDSRQILMRVLDKASDMGKIPKSSLAESFRNETIAAFLLRLFDFTVLRRF